MKKNQLVVWEGRKIFTEKKKINRIINPRLKIVEETIRKLENRTEIYPE